PIFPMERKAGAGVFCKNCLSLNGVQTLQISSGIDRGTVAANLKMKMCTIGLSGIPHIADYLALLYISTGRNRQGAAMGITGCQNDSMVDIHTVAIAAVIVGVAAETCKHNVTGIRCYNCLSINSIRGNVHALVAGVEFLGYIGKSGHWPGKLSGSG